jgi:hypothetical protein
MPEDIARMVERGLRRVEQLRVVPRSLLPVSEASPTGNTHVAV